MQRPELESAYATTWTLGEYKWWTGWKRHHWPADIVRPGQKLYVFDKSRRKLTALVEITRGGSFSYSSKAEFRREVKRLTGERPYEERHWRRIPFSRNSIGVAAKAEIVQTVSIPLRGRFPQIGFKRLRNNERSDAVHGSIYMDAADLYLEGERQLRNHVKIERNPTLRTRAMTLWRQKDRLRCGACRFDFEEAYGTLGADFIEMHHVRPLGATRGKRKVSPTELVPLCSNCHRMVHRRRDRVLTVKELTYSRQAEIGPADLEDVY